MIPEFDENGNLPPGVHFCEWEEFKERFGNSFKRERMINGLELAMTQLKAAGCRTILKSLVELTELLPVEPYDLNAAMEFGKIQRELRQIGKPKGEIDALIAAVTRSVKTFSSLTILKTLKIFLTYN